ncbi:uncharacterized protein BO97DRAFT_407942 [Aspergillus homomorphus CBS 101889]|uniref:Protein efr3 n=1 Tax=Aspergillus homomorphus (strain CBS 101889) TaxID=1450537 RepID=A0A395HMI5_ASPHC|nr:hypothetical protein BO97DRAFT_407942 [Aspergillus homomorphus CBS 101889]RAL09047.1 hypothetical protein BO97DRAFT_407942 [Aspergillus homomorphus CBS 101889]
MESVRQSCRPKHQVLVLKCYPQYQKGVQEVKPNPSELSYLLYYASTRRSKLTKVGAFLEKRAARDVWRRKTGNVQVTLQILTALIEKVPRDLPIYARSILTILETVLHSRDITIVEDSITTFETFCSHQDMAALTAEHDFATQYREVVRTYASFAEIEASSQPNALAPSVPMALRWRNAGLRAIKGVVGSEAGLAADGGDSLRITLPVILENLCKGDGDWVTSLETFLEESEKADPEPEPAHKRRVSTATVQTVDTANGDPVLASQSAADADKKASLDVRLLALRCLERVVVTGSSRGQIRITTQLALEFILRKLRAGDTSFTLETRENWATSLMEIVAKWCPVQVRFIIPVTMMQILMDMKLSNETLGEPFAVIFLIDWLLKSPVNMIGLSVIDILLGLLQHMSFLLSSAGGEKAVEPSAKRREQLALLQKCIGDLTTHVYYGEQVVDMIRAILTRIKPAATHDQPPSPPQTDSPGARSQAPSVSGDSNSVAFSSDFAKITAFRAIKNILLVANSKQAAVAAGAEARDKVGIHVWQGTQWLLQESHNEVRYAYADAFLTWLKLETNQHDLLVNDKYSKIHSLRQEMSDIEKAGKRATSVGVNQREKLILLAQHNFLRLLHLTIYDIAHESATQISEIRLLHLLLTSLVENLGVNAVRFGLAMVLKLQTDADTAAALQTPTAKVNIGSLVYGYLWAVSEKFDLDSTNVGRDIQNEIIKRQKSGLWLDHIRLPPANLETILQGNSGGGNYSGDVGQLTPFNDAEELVRCIEDSYNFSLRNAANSPPASPSRSLAMPVLGQGSSSLGISQIQPLSATVREQMLSAWTRESCLATAEREKAERMSMNGSRAGTLAIRNQFTKNPNEGSSQSTTSPRSAQQVAAGLHNARRMSVPESARVRAHSSSRESPVHVNELRRVLSINDQEKLRRLSPLRGRLDASNRSVVSSSSESMVSGYSLSEFDADGISVRHQSRDGHDGDSMITPKASTSSFTGSQMYYMAHEDIPPVPPIPPSLSVTGNLASESQRSLATDRPSTAPGPRGQAVVNGKASTPAMPHQGNSLNKHKSRSSTGLAAQAADGDVSSDLDPRRDVNKLLEGFLSPAHAELRPGSARTRGGLGRRGVSGGIGRPPY